MDETTYKRLLALVGKSELDQVIDLLLDMQLRRSHRMVAITISRQYHRFNLDRLKGIFSLQEQQLVENQIADRLVGLIHIIKAGRNRNPLTWLARIASFFTLKGKPSFWFWISNPSKDKKRLTIMMGTPLVIGLGLLLSSYWAQPSHGKRTAASATFKRPDHMPILDNIVPTTEEPQVVLPQNGEAFLSIDSCKLIARHLSSKEDLPGSIFPETSDPEKRPRGVPDIHVYVVRNGCPDPIAEAWTDQNGDYVLHIDSGAPFPDSIIIEDPTDQYVRVAEKFLLTRPNFHYPIRKK
jgi:hypothetical protein